MNSPIIPRQQSQAPAIVERPRATLAGLRAEISKKLPLRRSERIVYLVIDCSSSMQAACKLRNAANGAFEFARQAYAKSYQVGLIRFGSDAENVLLASRDESALRLRLDALSADGSTNMTAAIEQGIVELQSARGERVLYVVTDGQPDDRNGALAAAAKAKALGISIMTLGTDDADQDFLAKLATRVELSAKVERTQLRNSVSDMARFLLSDGRSS